MSTVDAIVQDLRIAARALRKRLGFTTVAVLTLAIGIGSLATVALVLAMLGVYGVLAFTVVQRTRDDPCPALTTLRRCPVGPRPRTSGSPSCW